MTTIVELTEQELAELKVLTEQAEDAAAIRTAMTEYLRFARRMQLKALSGRVQMADNWQSLEGQETNNAGGSANPGGH